MSINSFSRVLAGQELSFTQKLTSFVGVLDNFSTATTHGYSLRKLRTAYTGNAIRVRRSSDNTEQDIGFTSAGDLDQTALTNFVGKENLCLNSEQAGSWTVFNTSVSASNTETAPNGTLTADTIQINAATNAHTIYRNITVTGVVGQTYVFSAYVKAGTTNLVQLSTGGADFANAYANFNLTTGTSTQSSGCTPAISSVGNGWFRISMSAVAATTSHIVAIGFINSPTAARNPSYLGNNTDTLIIWGMQFNTVSLKEYIETTTTVKAGDGFVTTWYDQMGSNNATQVTAADQPRLVGGGVVKTYNSKPGVEWHNSGSTNTGLFTSSAINSSVQAHTVSLLRTGFSADARLITNVRVTGATQWSIGYTTGAVNGGSAVSLTGVSALPLDTLKVVDVFGSSSGVAYIGNVLGFPRSWYGGISEVVFFRTATTEPERLAIDANMMSYYGIS